MDTAYRCDFRIWANEWSELLSSEYFLGANWGCHGYVKVATGLVVATCYPGHNRYSNGINLLEYDLANNSHSCCT